MRKELKRVAGKAKNEYLECICHKIMEFQGRGPYDLMYMKMKELGCKENHEIQNVGIEHTQGNIIIDQGQVLKTGDSYITALCD
jgi:hypothetical protein